MFGKRGQATLEYVLVITAIIAAIIFAAMRFVNPRVSSSLDHVSHEMRDQVGRIHFGGGGGGNNIVTPPGGDTD